MTTEEIKKTARNLELGKIGVVSVLVFFVQMLTSYLQEDNKKFSADISQIVTQQAVTNERLRALRDEQLPDLKIDLEKFVDGTKGRIDDLEKQVTELASNQK